MISNELLHVMSVDELRNYAKHLDKLVDCMNELIYAKNQLNDSLQACFNNARFEAGREKEYQYRHTMFQELNDSLIKEHYKELPHLIPTCDCADGERRDNA